MIRVVPSRELLDGGATGNGRQGVPDGARHRHWRQGSAAARPGVGGETATGPGLFFTLMIGWPHHGKR